MNRPSSSDNVKTTKLQIVPWFSKKEWLETYQQAYSADSELQAKAYTQMSIWKARYPNLPLGVESTMSTLHVKLCDKETDVNDSGATYKDSDLQLLYSTAVMRFLNQLTVLSDRKDSMYKMAQQHQLPDWMINLRHEAAHGNSVPALYLLRQASDVILQWLKENYWEAEAHIMEDVVRRPEEEKEYTCSKITKLLDLWVTLKIHYWSEFKTIDKIEDEDIREQAMNLAKGEQGLGIKLSTESREKNVNKKGKTKENDGVDVEMEVEDSNIQNIGENCQEYTHKIKTAFEPLLRKIFEPLKSKTYKKIMYQNCLIDCIIKHTGFCPPIEVEQLSESEVMELMSLMGDLWKNVVEDLQDHNLLHCLLKQLVSQEDQLVSSQLWLRLVTQLIAGHPPPQPPGTARLSQMLAQSLPCAVKPEVLLKRTNLHHTKILKPINLKAASAEEIEVLQELAKKVVGSPTKFTTQYLHSLLSLWEPQLSWEAKEKLCTLARIYTGRQPLRNPPCQVYTSASLGPSFMEAMVTEEEERLSSENTESNASPWILYSGQADWSSCPFGALPW